MLTPSWESSPGALLALLTGIDPTKLGMVDLYTITLAGGQVLRYTGGDVPITLGASSGGPVTLTGDRPDIRRGRWRLTAVGGGGGSAGVGAGGTWLVGPIIQRGRIKVAIGISVDSLQLRISATPDVTVNGMSFIAFIAQVGFRGARVTVERLFCDAAGVPVGTIVRFTGAWAEATGGRHEKSVTIESDTAKLNTMIPGEVYQTGCKNSLFDTRCGLNKAVYTRTGAATTASTTRTAFTGNISMGVDWYARGVLTMTSGANAGVSRTLRSNSAYGLVVTAPFPFDVAVGDTFTLIPGCDKTQATCLNKFSNGPLRFRGEPYIPAPSTIT